MTINVGAKVDTDLPYLEPLSLHLKKDTNLHAFFSESDFFADLKIETDIEELIEKDCLAPRSLIIYPGTSSPMQAGQRSCFSKRVHQFHLFIFIQCIRDHYEFTKNDEGEIKLKGQVMELTRIRAAVKKSIQEFALLNEANYSVEFDKFQWLGDASITQEKNLLLSESIYSVNILK